MVHFNEEIRGDSFLKKLLWLFSICFIVSGCSSSLNESQQMSVTIFKIGKANSILISYHDQHVLIDTGKDDDAAEILNYLQENQIAKLHALIITHFDKDHVGGADKIVEKIDIDNIYTANYISDSKQTVQFKKVMAEKGLEPIMLIDTANIVLQDQTITLYPAEKSAYDGDNDYSIVATVDYQNISMLFAGDAEQKRLEEILHNEQLARTYDFVKMPHHGRYNELTQSFVEVISPRYAVITSSNKHIEDERTIHTLDAVGAEVYVTRNGDIKVITDGKTINVKQ